MWMRGGWGMSWRLRFGGRRGEVKLVQRGCMEGVKMALVNHTKWLKRLSLWEAKYSLASKSQ